MRYDFHFCVTILQHSFIEHPSCQNIKEEADLVQKAYNVCNQEPGMNLPRKRTLASYFNECFHVSICIPSFFSVYFSQRFEGRLEKVRTFERMADLFHRKTHIEMSS